MLNGRKQENIYFYHFFWPDHPPTKFVVPKLYQSKVMNFFKEQLLHRFTWSLFVRLFLLYLQICDVFR